MTADLSKLTDQEIVDELRGTIDRALNSPMCIKWGKGWYRHKQAQMDRERKLDEINLILRDQGLTAAEMMKWWLGWGAYTNFNPIEVFPNQLRMLKRNAHYAWHSHGAIDG